MRCLPPPHNKYLPSCPRQSPFSITSASPRAHCTNCNVPAQHALSNRQSFLIPTVKMPANSAAWITTPKSSPLEVREAPYPSPGANDVVVRIAAVAINPLEYKIQDNNPPIGGKAIEYPTILGADLAGTVVSVGSAVTTRKVGERIIANANGAQTGRPAMSAFQRFAQIPESATTPVPDDMSLEAAVVLPLACDTAMAGLFVQDQLGLSTAKLEGTESASSAQGSVLLVWGGSSSVGCCAIQMAHAAGYEVYTTASKRNHALCSSLGASKVFDHAESKVEEMIVTALEKKTVVGALDCIADGETTVPACARILARSNGLKKVVTVMAPPKTGLADGVKTQRCEQTGLSSNSRGKRC